MTDTNYADGLTLLKNTLPQAEFLLYSLYAGGSIGLFVNAN